MVLHNFKPQIQLVIQAQQQNNASVCLTPEAELQATSGHPVGECRLDKLWPVFRSLSNQVTSLSANQFSNSAQPV